MGVTAVSNITQFSDLTGTPNQNHLLFDPVFGSFWLFYAATKSASGVSCVYSTDNGATWNAGTASGAMPSGRGFYTGSQRPLGLVPFSNGTVSGAHVSAGVSTQAGPASNATEHVRCEFTSASGISWDTWAETLSANGSSPPAVLGNVLGVSTTGFVHETSLTLSANFSSGFPTSRISANADTGPTWTTGFGSRTNPDSQANFIASYALAPLAAGAMLLVYGNGGAAQPNTTGLRSTKYTSGTSWPTAGSGATGNGTTSQDQNDWCLAAVDTTHIYCLRRTSGGIDCRMYSGTAWSTPASTVPAFTTLAGSGIAWATDGTSLWLFAINSAGTGISYCQGTSASGTISWAGSWTTLESGLTGLNYITGCAAVGNGTAAVAYSVTNGSNFDIGVSALSLGGPTFAWQQLTNDLVIPERILAVAY